MKCFDLVKKYIPEIFSVVCFLAAAVVYLTVRHYTSPERLLTPYKAENAADLVTLTEYRYSDHDDHLEILIPSTPDFWIDQIPVTVEAYKNCVESGKCSPPHYNGDFTVYYSDSKYSDYPVTFVAWHEALQYCQVNGGILPTVYQWETAAGLYEGRVYPWGSKEPDLSLANFDSYYQDLTPAGAMPKGASPFGVLDMAGNVREWVMNTYDPEIPYSAGTDVTPPETMLEQTVTDDHLARILKGGGAFDYMDALETLSFMAHAPQSSGFNRGFRCIYNVE